MLECDDMEWQCFGYEVVESWCNSKRPTLGSMKDLKSVVKTPKGQKLNEWLAVNLVDNIKFKKPIKVSTPEYVDQLMTWVEDQNNNEQIFTNNSKTIVKTIFKRLFRVCGDILPRAARRRGPPQFVLQALLLLHRRALEREGRNGADQADVQTYLSECLL